MQRMDVRHLAKPRRAIIVLEDRRRRRTHALPFVATDCVSVPKVATSVTHWPMLAALALVKLSLDGHAGVGATFLSIFAAQYVVMVSV